MPLRVLFMVLALAAQILLVVPKLPASSESASFFPHIDKVVHYALFMLTTWAVLRFWQNISAPIFFLSIGSLLGWALLSEFIQSFYPHRFASALDLLANSLGILAGIGLYYLEKKFD